MANQAEIPIGDGSLRIGDRVVYPNQGICRITSVDEKEIAGQRLVFVSLAREEDGATVMVPSTKVMGIGLRKVANVDAIDEVFDYLASPSDDPQLDWKVRHRENADKMTGGGLFGTVEVLKGLHALSRVRPLPQKERELYDSARHLIVGEIAAAMGIPLAVAENNLDYALFPPPGMKRKGKELQPAAIPATGGPLRRGGDDDLGFDDEAGEEEDATPAKAGPRSAGAGEEEEQEEEAEELAVPSPAAASPARAQGKPAGKPPHPSAPAPADARAASPRPAAQGAGPRPVAPSAARAPARAEPAAAGKPKAALAARPAPPKTRSAAKPKAQARKPAAAKKATPAAKAKAPSKPAARKVAAKPGKPAAKKGKR